MWSFLKDCGSTRAFLTFLLITLAIDIIIVSYYSVWIIIHVQSDVERIVYHIDRGLLISILVHFIKANWRHIWYVVTKDKVWRPITYIATHSGSEWHCSWTWDITVSLLWIIVNSWSFYWDYTFFLYFVETTWCLPHLYLILDLFLESGCVHRSV